MARSERPATGWLAQLLIGVDEDGVSGILCYWGNEGRFFSTGPDRACDELESFLCGSGFYFPVAARIPVDEVRAGAADFITSGGRSLTPGVNWHVAGENPDDSALTHSLRPEPGV